MQEFRGTYGREKDGFFPLLSLKIRVNFNIFQFQTPYVLLEEKHYYFEEQARFHKVFCTLAFSRKKHRITIFFLDFRLLNCHDEFTWK